jgi:hypothetical protein
MHRDERDDVHGHRSIRGGTLFFMSSTSNLSDLQERRKAAAADLASIDHAIASVEALEHSNMIDAPCPHCDFVVQADGGMTFHMRDVHPNPLVYPDSKSQ